MIVNATRLIPDRTHNVGFQRWILNPFFRLVAYLVSVALLLAAGSWLLGIFFRGSALSDNMTTYTNTIVFAILLFLFYRFLILKIEKRPVYELSGSMVATELFTGMLLGAVLIFVVVLILAIPGFYAVQDFNSGSALVKGLFVFGYGAFFEELLFRLIVFKLLEEYFGSWISIALSSVFFGVAHLFNENATAWSAVAIALEAGVLLSMAFIFTRRIWMALGIHFTWNFMQASVFGLPASGVHFESLISARVSGPLWLTGGEFGIEASVLTVLMGLILAWVLCKKAISDDQIILPAWRVRKKTEIRY